MTTISNKKSSVLSLTCGAAGLLTAAITVTPANADRITATCGTISGVGNAEANYLYYEAEARFGSGAAGRLYSAYHQLKSKCQHNPAARVVVNVQPGVRAFFEARR